eukprot:GHVL01036444.1.p2 GENE.GHVL01036444.1~~GHVL01036444.1.p2  ORF type:complete len:557 (+),score=151.89 GHVL01036444.1:619-2289(+)
MEPDSRLKIQQQPRMILALDKEFATEVACGGYHTMVIVRESAQNESNGGLYVFGCADSGRLGIGPLLAHETGDEKKFDKYGSCSPTSHNLAPGGTPHNFAPGGTPHNLVDTPEGLALYEPMKIMKNIKITDISCGWNYSICIANIQYNKIINPPRGGTHEGPGGSPRGSNSDKYDKIINPPPGGINSENNNNNLYISNPQGISSNNTVYNNITSGGDICVAYSWGAGSCGALGLGDRYDRYTPTLIDRFDRYTPTLITEGIKDLNVMQISCGRFHTAMILDNGYVYTCGNGDNGRLGLGDLTERLSLTRVNRLPRCRMVACGGAHSSALDESLGVWIWGSNEHGQVGLTTKTHSQCEVLPRNSVFLDGKGICYMSLGASHTIACTLSGLVYSWGSNETAQLGHSKDLDCTLMPTVVEKVLSFPCVQVFASDHQSYIICENEPPWVNTERFDQWKRWLEKTDDKRRVTAALKNEENRLFEKKIHSKKHSAIWQKQARLTELAKIDRIQQHKNRQSKILKMKKKDKTDFLWIDELREQPDFQKENIQDSLSENKTVNQ